MLPQNTISGQHVSAKQFRRAAEEDYQLWHKAQEVFCVR